MAATLIDLIKRGKGSGVDATKYLRSDGSGGWVLINPLDQPRCKVFNSVNESIPNAAFTAVTFDSEEFDTDSMHSTVTNTDRITFNTAGTYLVGASIDFVANNAGYRSVHISKGGTVALVLQTQVTNMVGPPDAEFSCNVIAAFIVGDWIRCNVLQTSGGPLNAQALAGRSPEMYAIRLGP
jgi:hypothetical protein